MTDEPTDTAKCPDETLDAIYRTEVWEKLKPGGELFVMFRSKHQLQMLIEVLTVFLESDEPTAG